MNAERLLQHYEQIVDAPDAIARLRRFILDLAVWGKLVPQDLGEGQASDTLNKVLRERKRQWENLNSKTSKAHPAPPHEEGRFSIPLNWAWASALEVCERIEAGSTPSASEMFEQRGDVPFIKVYNLTFDGSLDFSVRPTFVSKHTHDGKLARSKILPNDVLMNIVGPPLGKVSIVPDTYSEWNTNQAVVLFRCLPELLPRYLATCLRSEAVLGWIIALAQQTVGQVNISVVKSRRLPVPLPPLAEQHRIVAKVDELMALCDELEAARTEREAKRDRLAAASLARLNTPDQETFRDDARFALDALPALTARPDQIKQLRQTILNLAVRGKLSVNDGWVDKPVRVGDVASLQNGYAFKSEWFAKSGTRLVRNANVGHGKLNWAEEVRLPESLVREFERFRLSEGDIVVSLDRPFIVTGTKVARISSDDLPALLLQRVGRFVLTPNICADFLYLWINSPHFSEQIDPGRSNGVPHISSKQVESATIFVPPLAEQHRIVAKVEELMALCDQLETSLTSADETRKKLLDALLAEALVPLDVEALQAAAE